MSHSNSRFARIGLFVNPQGNRRSGRLHNNVEASLPPNIPEDVENPLQPQPAQANNDEEQIPNILRRQLPPPNDELPNAELPNAELPNAELPNAELPNNNDDVNVANPPNDNNDEPQADVEPQANNDNNTDEPPRPIQANRGRALSSDYLVCDRQYKNAIKNFKSRQVPKLQKVCSQTQLSAAMIYWDRKDLGLGTNWEMVPSDDMLWPMMHGPFVLLKYAAGLYYSSLIERLTMKIPTHLALHPEDDEKRDEVRDNAAFGGDALSDDTGRAELKRLTGIFLLNCYRMNPMIGMKYENVAANELHITSRSRLYIALDIAVDDIPSLPEHLNMQNDAIAPLPQWNLGQRIVVNAPFHVDGSNAVGGGGGGDDESDDAPNEGGGMEVDAEGGGMEVDAEDGGD